MKSPTISQLEKELKTLPLKRVLEICVRIAKHKKENKELLTYLLYGSVNEKAYVEDVKEEINILFTEINRKSTYTVKKGLQKTVRNMNKKIKYSGDKKSEIELRIFFCKKIKSARISIDSSSVIHNLYHREIEKIRKIFEKLHEDLQFDYRSELEDLKVI
ncbi:MAG: hypothetical protein K0Q95_3091 [Bacteroidota bacterium]|jgi:hypothetical protein|nr:hypothetical protein [Bacteroidota bacterium]